QGSIALRTTDVLSWRVLGRLGSTTLSLACGRRDSIPARIISPILLFGFGSLGCPLSSSRRHSCGVSVIRLVNSSASTRRRLQWREGITPGSVSVWTCQRSSYRSISCCTGFDA
ncbi:hypothetical protein LINPERHAP2_LOCUS6119, partial [Linum perenne]